MPVDPKRPAVVLIEYQNDFTSAGGALHGAVQDVMAKTGMLDNTGRLVEAARAAGATIVHAPITFAPGYGELSEHPYGILKGVVDSTAFVKGERARRSSTRWRPTRVTWSSKASAAWTRSPQRTSTSSCAPAESPPSRSVAS